jgi:hypothetical protein
MTSFYVFMDLVIKSVSSVTKLVRGDEERWHTVKASTTEDVVKINISISSLNELFLESVFGQNYSVGDTFSLPIDTGDFSPGSSSSSAGSADDEIDDLLEE